MIIDAHNHLVVSHVRDETGVLRAAAIDGMCKQMRRGGVAAVGLVIGGTVAFPQVDAASPWAGTIDGLERFWRGHEDERCELTILDSAEQIDGISVEYPAVLLGLEGGDPCFGSPLGDPVAALHLLALLGVHSLQLLGDPDGPAFEPASNAADALRLSTDGRALIREANRLGMVIDLAHLPGEVPAFEEIITLSASPPIASHHSCRAVTGLSGALSDDAIRVLAGAGGVIGIHSGSNWLCGPDREATIGDMIRHICHAADLVGVDHVAIGTDYVDLRVIPGDFSDTVFMAGFGGPEDLDVVDAALSERGFDEDDRRKILAENVLRIWRAALPC